MNDAKTLFMADPKYYKGFKFDHLWVMLKDLEKFKDNGTSERQSRRRKDSGNYYSSDDQTAGSPAVASPGLSPFSINLDDDDSHGSSSQRPTGVKKSKLKKKINDEMAEDIKKLRETNERLEQRLESATHHRQRVENMLQRVVEHKATKEEHRIMSMNVEAVEDPFAREYFRAERNKIIEKRRRQQQQQEQERMFSPSNDLDQYFNNIGGSRSDVPEY